jgi:hypothetical protein
MDAPLPRTNVRSDKLGRVYFVPRRYLGSPISPPNCPPHNTCDGVFRGVPSQVLRMKNMRNEALKEILLYFCIHGVARDLPRLFFGQPCCLTALPPQKSVFDSKPPGLMHALLALSLVLKVDPCPNLSCSLAIFGTWIRPIVV